MRSKYESNGKVAAVVVGCELNGLGVIRSLARAGVPVVAVDTDSSKAALWSRHPQRRLIRGREGREFVEDMIELGKEFAYPPVLILTTEESVHCVSENRKELSRWYRFRLPTNENVKLLSSKAGFHDFSLRNDFPVPRTAILESESDLALLTQLRFPCVMKPDDKRNVLNGNKERTVRVGSLNEAREHAAAMLETPGGIVVQEWIEGAESNIYFTLFYRGESGRFVAVFTGRKLACSPHDVGSTAICVAAPEAGNLLEPMTLAFADRASMDGMGSMEYKWDDNHSKFVMIEPTVGRTDWQEEIATLCGVNIPLAAYRHELGLPVDSPVTNGSAVAWRANLPHKPPPHLRRAASHTVDGYFRWNDPLPAFQFYCLNYTLHGISRLWNRTE
ncbi:carboxylate--amine ligase [Paraburkholderia sp. CNPSo 3157]|uniref:Carboxylate--amine ligase n=1 Tax=Paraburkholderia franconis TaxID=2654983 RepID=A0A7X1N9I9_9BURK|nr:carboxylate--amine ligase [Paraburkholderia franconis]MPW17423.1 carboxylate--amine ligase [Paraburkholderia franconis]